MFTAHLCIFLMSCQVNFVTRTFLEDDVWTSLAAKRSFWSAFTKPWSDKTRFQRLFYCGTDRIWICDGVICYLSVQKACADSSDVNDNVIYTVLTAVDWSSRLQYRDCDDVGQERSDHSLALIHKSCHINHLPEVGSNSDFVRSADRHGERFEIFSSFWSVCDRLKWTVRDFLLLKLALILPAPCTS